MTKAGETVLGTERDEVIAELRPARRHSASATNIEGILDDLAGDGHIVRASQPKATWTWKVNGMGFAPGTTAALLDRLREDRQGYRSAGVALPCAAVPSTAPDIEAVRSVVRRHLPTAQYRAFLFGSRATCPPRQAFVAA